MSDKKLNNTYNDEDFFQICPKCRIGYDISNNDLFDHILDCDGRPDIITTRYIRTENLYKRKKLPKLTIDVEATFRPVTR